MRLTWVLFAVMAVCLLLVSGVSAADKEITLKGDLTCAKCELKEKGVKKCVTVILVKEDGKEVVYHLKDKGAKEEYHEAVCGGGRKAGTVIGKVSEEAGKKWITPTKVEYAEK